MFVAAIVIAVGACSNSGTPAGSAGSAGTAGGTSTGVAGDDGAGAGPGTDAATGEPDADAGPSVAPGARSAGCGMTTTQTLGDYVKFTESVPGVPAAWMSRNYYVRLPAGYDPTRAYQTVFVGPGCGSTGQNHGIAIYEATGETIIVVALESAMSPEVPYFDETLAAVKASFCVDTGHVYAEGFSSGSWLTNLLGCARGNELKGQGNASGCTPPLPTCTGPIAYMEAHDTSDPENSYSCGTANRDRMVALNGCSSTTTPYDPGPGVAPPAGKTISCVQYDGCRQPVVFCTTTGLGHTSQEETHLSTNGFWNFWTSLP
jgi:poly(3-hydroxybutyrate) depolymerase